MIPQFEFNIKPLYILDRASTAINGELEGPNLINPQEGTPTAVTLLAKKENAQSAPFIARLPTWVPEKKYF